MREEEISIPRKWVDKEEYILNKCKICKKSLYSNCGILLDINNFIFDELCKCERKKNV